MASQASEQTGQLVRREVLEKQIDQYVFELGAVLGSGSYSVVYKGRCLKSGQPVAIKVINKALFVDEMTLQNTRKEIKIMEELDHPNLVRFLAVFQTVNNIYVIMEYCEGGNLLSFLRQGPLSDPAFWRIVTPLVSALRYLHSRLLLHRDIKPQNVLLKDGVPKLSDFGFACQLADGPDTVFMDNMGSPLYMSPQLLRYAPYTCKCDIWSLGILMYEMHYGESPWTAQTRQQLTQKTFTQPLKLKRASSPAILQLLLGCLKIQEAERFNYAELGALVQKQAKTQNEPKEYRRPRVTSLVKQPADHSEIDYVPRREMRRKEGSSTESGSGRQTRQLQERQLGDKLSLVQGGLKFRSTLNLASPKEAEPLDKLRIVKLKPLRNDGQKLSLYKRNSISTMQS